MAAAHTQERSRSEVAGWSCLLLASVALSTACGGSSAAPSPTPTPPPTPTTVSLTGRVSATNGGQALAAIAVAFGSAITATTTDAAGRFTTALLPAAGQTVTLSGPGIVTRAATVDASTTRDVALDAIALGGDFDLEYYRALVRNRLEAPLQPLARWTQSPKIYLRTVDEGGVAIDRAALDTIEANIRAAVAEWTGGLLSIATVERGTDSREGVSGWITVKVPATPSARCGLTLPAVDGGWVELELRNVRCQCGGFAHAPRSVRHEIGHALGLFHTDRPEDLMWAGDWTAAQCDAHPTPRELAHAAIAYRRRPGNRDPDSDVGLTALRFPRAIE